MTIGIYALKFSGTTKQYIGKSLNIEKRFLDHKSNFRNHVASPKLQHAFDKYGVPSLEILKTCSPDTLGIDEVYFINLFNAINNGYNTLPGSMEACYGEDIPASDYTNEMYYEVLRLLVDQKSSIESISSSTGVAVQVVGKIAALSTHKWLKDKYPEEYSVLENIFNTGGRKGISITRPLIMSPTGDTYTITNLRAFSKEHNLSESKVHNVLSGCRNTHKGWHLATYIAKAPYPTIISPKGEAYTIEFGTAKEFASVHGLTYPLLHRVLTHKQTTHKGWKLAEPSEK